MTYASRLAAWMFGLAATAGIPAWAAPEITGRPVEHQLNMQLPVTGVGADIYDLHNWMMIVCLVIFVGVFGVMFYSVFKHRKSLGQHLNLKPLLESETLGTNAWQQLLIDDTPSVTSGALDRATLLGVDMLRGHKVDLIAPTRRFGGTRG